MKKVYVAPRMEVIQLEEADIVCSSALPRLTVEEHANSQAFGDTPPIGVGNLNL